MEKRKKISEKDLVRQKEISYILETFSAYKNMKEVQNILQKISETRCNSKHEEGDINFEYRIAFVVFFYFLDLEAIIKETQKSCPHTRTCNTFDRKRRIKPHLLCLECGKHIFSTPTLYHLCF